jgi:hypothetical protein
MTGTRDKVGVRVELPSQVLVRALARARRGHRTLSEVVERAMRAYLASVESRGAAARHRRLRLEP